MSSNAPIVTDGIRLILAAGGAAGITQAYNGWRQSRRDDRLDPARTLTDAADRVAQSAVATVEALIAPLRAELAEVRRENLALREEVHLMRDALNNAGLPVPATRLRSI